MSEYKVVPITREMAKPWVLKKHYAHQMPTITQHYYGLYNGNELEGVVVYGPTCARELNNGKGAFGGKPLAEHSFELLRLVIDSDNPNAASMLVGRSLKLLPQPAFVVSYADANFGHVGYVYQATNWLYTGVTAKESIYVNTKTGDKMHPRAVVHKFGTRAQESLPDYITTGQESKGKHRYIAFVGNRRQRQKMRGALVYPVLDYPKGNTKRHDDSTPVAKQRLLFA